MAALIIHLSGWTGTVRVTAGGLEYPVVRDRNDPVFTAEVPPGRYDVEVVPDEPEQELATQKRSVKVGYTPTRVVFFAVLDPELSRGPGEPPEVLLRDGAWLPYQLQAGLVTVIPSPLGLQAWPALMALLADILRKHPLPFQPPQAPAALRELESRLLAPAPEPPPPEAEDLATLMLAGLRLGADPPEVRALALRLAAGPPALIHLGLHVEPAALVHLRRSPLVAAAGPTVDVAGRFVALLSTAVLRFRPEAHAGFLDRLLLTTPGSRLEQLFAPGLYRLHFSPGTSTTLPDEVWRISEQFSNEIETIDLEVAGVGERHGWLSGLQTHLHRMGVPEDLERFGPRDAPVIAVVDRALAFVGLGNIGLGDRLLAAFGVDPQVPVLVDGPPREMAHGAACAAIAAGPQGDGGLVSIAPEARVRPVEMVCTVEASLAHVLFRAAGLATGADPADPGGDPGNGGHDRADAAAVFSCSVALSIGQPTTGLIHVLRRLTRRGRRGRGCVFFCSAGNDGEQVYQRDLGFLFEAVACGATCPAGDATGSERRAEYSNRGADLCAPSSVPVVALVPAQQPVLHVRPPALNGPLRRLAGADLTDPNHLRIAPADVVAGDYLALRVLDDVQMAQVGAPPVRVPDGLELELQWAEATPSPAFVHDPTCTIELLTGVGRFGGTSAATPQCAAVAALLLQVAPDLTWVEVFDIMRETASHDLLVEVGTSLQPAQWPASGLHDEFGWGRVDAAAALQAAAERQARVAERWLHFASIRLMREDEALETHHLVWGEAHTLAIVLRRGGADPVPNTTVRVLVAGAGFNGVFPDAWDATQQPGPGTWDDAPRLIGEVDVGPVDPERRVVLPWPATLIPPEGAACKVLLEITPQLGPDISSVEPGTNPNLATVDWPIGAPQPA